MEFNKAFYRVGEVAELLSIGKSLAYRMVAEGKIPSVWIAGSRSRRVPAAALMRWIAEQNLKAEEASDGGTFDDRR
jgi:excisionase family DNA binding protein